MFIFIQESTEGILILACVVTGVSLFLLKYNYGQLNIFSLRNKTDVDMAAFIMI